MRDKKNKMRRGRRRIVKTRKRRQVRQKQGYKEKMNIKKRKKEVTGHEKN